MCSIMRFTHCVLFAVVSIMCRLLGQNNSNTINSWALPLYYHVFIHFLCNTVRYKCITVHFCIMFERPQLHTHIYIIIYIYDITYIYIIYIYHICIYLSYIYTSYIYIYHIIYVSCIYIYIIIYLSVFFFLLIIISVIFSFLHVSCFLTLYISQLWHFSIQFSSAKQNKQCKAKSEFYNYVPWNHYFRMILLSYPNDNSNQ
jgi:hypothetical protein